MLVTLIAAISADGYIARTHDELVSWSSKEDKKFFVRETKRIGTIIMGRTTFETIGRALPERRMIVMTRTPDKYQVEAIEFTDENPLELLTRLDSEGVEQVAITGGAEVYTQFLNAGLVDRCVLTFENVELGDGLPLTNAPITPDLRHRESVYLSDKTHVQVFDVLN